MSHPRHSCPYAECKYSTFHKSHLGDHVLAKHTGERPFPCTAEGCTYASHTRPNLVRHLRCHTKERPFPCTAAGCAESFSRVDVLKRHVARAHTDARPFLCEHPGCSFSTKTRDEQRSHVRVHGELLQCPHEGCSYRASQKQNVQRHVERMHGGQAASE